jgi:hypothetical protein
MTGPKLSDRTIELGYVPPLPVTSVP